MNAQILSWSSNNCKMGSNYVNLLPNVNSDSTDSAISDGMETNSFTSETAWHGNDNNGLTFALDSFDFDSIDAIIKQESTNFDYGEIPSSLELCEFINEEASVRNKRNQKKVREVAGRKKIDLQSRQYIVEQPEEESVDVETVTENPVLEAKDIVSLLEQFEASEATESLEAKQDASSFSSAPKTSVKKEIVKTEPKHTPHSKNKQIIEALPKELIERIKESGKRKCVEIIDPFPNNKIKKRKLPDNFNEAVKCSETSGNISYEHISLDHDYCMPMPTPQTRQIQIFKKDSGYLSEEDKIVLQNQPVVQNSDGKLMVSLLKTNANKLNKVEEKNHKKKLNIDEYKKRRFGLCLSAASSQSSSPINSNCNSPSPVIEDENLRRIKHEEKLRKMALEVLRTPPKKDTNANTNNFQLIIPKEEPVPVAPTAPPVTPVPAPKKVKPTDMIVKTYVSIGVNTELTIEPIDCKKNIKIDSNSLINSIIENVPKYLKSNANQNKNAASIIEHGEDKTIIYLPKDKKPPKTSSVEVQTSITLVSENKRRYRRRKESDSESSDDGFESKCGRNSRNSLHSKYSRSSRSISSSSSSSSSRSISSSSSSRSRSKSPAHFQTTKKRKSFNYDREYIQEVEERRVVYIGKIAPRTTKEQLYKRFVKFGPIKAISLHFRNKGRKDLDNYGFVTYENKQDAYRAIEHGNDDPSESCYDLSFGGRRLFCQTTYADLDNVREDGRYRSDKYRNSKESFDDLLKEMKEKLKKRRA